MNKIQKQIAEIEKGLDESNKLAYDNIRNAISHINSQEKIKIFVENTYIELKKIEANEIRKLMTDDFYKQYLEREVNKFLSMINNYLTNMINNKSKDNYTLDPIIDEYEAKYPLLVKDKYNELLEKKKIFDDAKSEIKVGVNGKINIVLDGE